MNNRIISTAEPFFFPGDRTGCLLVHGFTGTPKEMRWLGEFLAQQGRTVLGVRLTGHATQPKDILRARWPDWVASVEDGWNLLSGCTDRIVVIGLSMGGVLSLLFASQHPVAGVVAMATPYRLPPDPRLPYLKILRWIKPTVDKGPPGWHNPEIAQWHVDYPDYYTRAIVELRDLIAEMRSCLPSVTAPALLIYSKDDTNVRAEEQHMEKICEALGSQKKQMHWVKDSSHVITEDKAREEVFQKVAAFVAQVQQEAA